MNKIPLLFEPKTFDFKQFVPYLSKSQSEIHYNGHYMKYINNFNKLLESDKKLEKISCDIKKMVDDNLYRNTLLLTIVELFDENSYIVHNVAQIYNHELYWKSLTTIDNSLCALCTYKDKIFTSNMDFTDCYTKFIELGTKHFGSGWLWLVYENNSINWITTQDAIIPLHNKILAVIDLWEHAYYVDWTSERKKYLENIFKIINWERIYSIIKN